MASLFNTKISNTYVGLIKTIDNAVISASLRELTDGSGNQTGVYLNNAGDFKASGTLEFGSLKDTGENITITKFVDEADGIASNDNDTTIPTSAAVVDYVAARITLEDLDFSGDSGTGSVDLDSQTFAVVGTANEIETSAGSQQLQIGLPDNVTIGGNLQVNGLLKGNNNIVIKDTSDRTMAAFYGGNKTELYFNDSKKFETTGDGATVTGGLTATGGSVFTGATFSSNVTITGVLSVTGDGSNAATFTESGSGDFDIVSVDDLRLTSGGNDIVLKGASSSEFGRLSNDSQNFVIKNITTDKEIQFHAEAGGSTVEYLSIGGANEFIEFLKDARFGDSVKARFGASDDLQIYHDGSNSYIDDTGTGDLKIRGETNVYIAAATGGANMAQFTKGGAVKLRYNDSNKFETTNTGVTITGTIVADGLTMGDNEKAIFGTGGDLEVYHSGSTSYISDVGTGDLKVLFSNDFFIDGQNGETCAKFTENGAVELYYDNSKKLETTSDGVTITGSVSATTESFFYGGFLVTDSDKGKFGTGGDLEIYHDGSHSYIKDTGTGNLLITSDGASVQINKGSTENMAEFIVDGAVNLYYDSAKKFETTNTGIDVTGDIVASGDATITGGDIALGTNSIASNINSLGDVLNIVVDSNGDSGGTPNIQFKTASTTQLTLNSTTATFAGSVIVSNDLTVNGTTTTVNTSTLAVEDPLISMAKDNSANSVDIGFYGRYNDGSNRYLGLFADASDSNTFNLFKGTTTEPTTTVDKTATGFDYANLILGNAYISQYLYHFGDANTYLEFAGADNLKLVAGGKQFLHAHDNGSLYLSSNNSTAVTLDTSQNATFAGNVSLADTKYAIWGDGSDFKIHHNTSDTYLQNYTGHLYIQNNSDDKRIEFQCDDGSGGVETYFYCDGAGGGSQPFTVFPDNAVIAMGSNHDTYIQHTGSVGKIDNYTGDFEITNQADDGNLSLRCDNGSGGTSTYIQLDGGEVKSLFLKDSRHNDDVKANFGASSDLQIYHDATNSIIRNTTGDLYIDNYQDNGDIKFRSDDGSGSVTEYFRVDGGAVKVIASKNFAFTDNVKAEFGDSGDLEIFHDGTHSRIKDVGSGNLTINATDFVVNNSGDTKNLITAYDGGSVNLYYDASQKFRTVSSGVEITGSVQITGDGSNAATLTETGNGLLTIATVDDLVLDADNDLILDAGGNDIRLKVDGVEYGKFKDDSDDFAIFSSIQDKDIIFKGNDGGSTITALTLDMSNGGSATFRDDIDLGGKLTSSGTSGTNTLNTHLNIASGNLGIGDSTPDYSIEINQANPEIRLEETTTGGSKRLTLKVNTSTSNAEIGANQSAQGLVFQTTGSDRLIVNSLGDVAIGTSVPDTLSYGNTARIFTLKGISGDTSVQRPAVVNIAGQRDDGSDGYVSDLNFLNMASNGSTVNSRAIMRMSRSGADNSNQFEFWVTKTGTTNRRMTLDSDGRLQDVQGIYLGSNNNSNLLDDYEEGTWTPTIRDLGDNAATLATAQGTYTKIGRQVILNYRIELSSKGSMTGNYVLLGGIPFNHPTESYNGTGIVDKFNNMASNMSWLGWDTSSTATVFWLTGVVGTEATSSSYITVAQISDTTKIKGSIIYVTDV